MLSVPLAASFCLVLHAVAVPAANLQPLGAWFGGYQILAFNDEIAWPLDLYADAHYASPKYYQSGRG